MTPKRGHSPGGRESQGRAPPPKHGEALASLSLVRPWLRGDSHRAPAPHPACPAAASSTARPARACSAHDGPASLRAHPPAPAPATLPRGQAPGRPLPVGPRVPATPRGPPGGGLAPTRRPPGPGAPGGARLPGLGVSPAVAGAQGQGQDAGRLLQVPPPPPGWSGPRDPRTGARGAAGGRARG